MIKAVLILLLAAGTATADIRLALWDWLAADEAGAELWTPSDLDGLALWLDAADASTLWADTNATTAATNNGAVARWDDKSGNSYNFTQGTPGSRPTLSNGRVQFASKHMDGPSAFAAMFNGDNTPYSVAVAQQTTTTGSFQNLININDDDRESIFTQFVALGAIRGDNQYSYLQLRWGSSNSLFVQSTNSVSTNAFIKTATRASTGSLWINGSTGDQGVNTSFNFAGFDRAALGARKWKTTVDTYYQGFLDEIIITDSVLSTADRQKLEGYLAHKWGLTANLPADHPYQSSPPTK